MSAYVYTLCANFCFALGAIAFTRYSNKLGHLWMNKFKGLVAFILFLLSALYLNELIFPGGYIFSLLLLSGFLGLGFGDTLILKSFINMGPGRTLLIFGFQPAFLGILGYIFLKQSLRTGDLIGILFCILCLIILSAESRKKNLKFSFKYILIALTGILFDSFGVMISRYCFENSDSLTSFNVNFYRIIGAVFAYILIGYQSKKNIKVFKGVRLLTKRELIYVTFGAIFGTYISLSFFLKAVQLGNLAVVSAISLTGVIFSSTFECIEKRKWPSVYFLMALLCFLTGMYFVFTLN